MAREPHAVTAGPSRAARDTLYATAGRSCAARESFEGHCCFSSSCMEPFLGHRRTISKQMRIRIPELPLDTNSEVRSATRKLLNGAPVWGY